MRTHATLLSVALLCTLESPGVHAFDERHVSIILGLGGSTCGQMTDHVNRLAYGRAVYEQYINGYLTAINAGFPGSINFFAGTDEAARYKFVLQYCETNPLELVVSAVTKLVQRYKSDFPPE